MSFTRREMLGSALAAPLLGRRIRVAMIGLDGHPTEITGPLKELPEVEIVAISEPSETVVQRFVHGKERLRGARYYADPRRMLDETKPDLVAVCNNNGERAAAILECTSRRLPFIAEKPYATNRQDLRKVKQAIAATASRPECCSRCVTIRPTWLCAKSPPRERSAKCCRSPARSPTSWAQAGLVQASGHLR